jgi:SRSO17 transposase
VLGHADLQQPMHDYCLGLLMPIDRKSVEPKRGKQSRGARALQTGSLRALRGRGCGRHIAIPCNGGPITLATGQRTTERTRVGSWQRPVPVPSRPPSESLLHFVGNAPWSDATMLGKVAELVLPAIERSGPVEAWIIDGSCS